MLPQIQVSGVKTHSRVQLQSCQNLYLNILTCIYAHNSHAVVHELDAGWCDEVDAKGTLSASFEFFLFFFHHWICIKNHRRRA